MESAYQYKTKPFAHQKRIFEDTRDLEAYALFWEQGCGKTKPIIDTVAYLYSKGNIDALFVVAPNGVHRNWVNDEIPKHMPDDVIAKTGMFFYNTKKAKTIKHKNSFFKVLNHKGLAVFCMSYDGLMTEGGRKAAKEFLTKRKCFYVADESHRIKTPKAKRTKRAIASSAYAPYVRILSGTPIAQGPFDAYSQIRFLDAKFWLKYKLPTFQVFKTFFGVWRTRAEHKEEWGYDPGFDQLLGYKNLTKLSLMLKTISDRVTKDEVLDLPPKLYSKRYIEMTKQQVKLYKDLEDELMLELENGIVLDGSLAMVRMMRFQQITCGYVQVDSDEPIRLIEGKNPKLEACIEICDELPHPAIIWARFSHDIDQICKRLGDRCVRYDGRISDDEAFENQEKFKRGEFQFLVGNPAKGSEGLTWIVARTVIYYNNSFKLLERLQSEDRPHRIGQEHPVSYIDLVAPGTIDEHIVDNLVSKLDIAAVINSDTLKEWIK